MSVYLSPISAISINTSLNYKSNAACYVAGHTTHEWTSWSSFESIFKFFAAKYTARIDKLDMEQGEDNAPLSSDETPPSSDETPLPEHDSS